MQTFHPELTRHMDARREQRELASQWRIARASRRSAADSASREARIATPSTSGAAAVIRPC